MTSDFVKIRLKQKAELYPTGKSNEPVLELCREFAQEAFIAGIPMAFQDWLRNYVSPSQQGAVRRYLIERLPAIILSQYLPAQNLLAPVDLAEQLQKWKAKNPKWTAKVQEAAFDSTQLCEIVNPLYYTLLEFSRSERVGAVPATKERRETMVPHYYDENKLYVPLASWTALKNDPESEPYRDLVRAATDTIKGGGALIVYRESDTAIMHRCDRMSELNQLVA